METISVSVLLLSMLFGADATTPRDFIVEHPTLHCLGFRWFIDGDANRNATCDVAYRKLGDAAWREGYPLLRVMNEKIGSDDIAWTAPNGFAGSIVALAPGSFYEVKLSLHDPDGGDVEKQLTLQTRDVPRVPDDMRTVAVKPGTLREAYANATPGTILLLQPGIHDVPGDQESDRTDYRFDKKATADKPIVFRGLPGAILDGGGAVRLIDCQGSAHHWFENITFRNADHLFYAGREAGSVGLVIQRCRFEDSSFPIFAINADCEDFYIADSTFLGPAEFWHPRNLSDEKFGASHAIWLTGRGHVVCRNRITMYWDGIDVFGRRPPDDPSLHNTAMDFYDNDLDGFADDAIETDYSVANVRVWGNRIVNTLMGISAQPVYGEPVYIFRNTVFNCTLNPIKPNQNPAGLMIFHNTFVSAGSAGRWADLWQNSRIVNNLFLGKDGGPGVIWTGTPTPATSVLDYNGWRFHTVSEPYPIWWSFPVPRNVWNTSTPTTECVFRDLAHFTAETGCEQHGLIIDYDALVDVPIPTGDNGAPPPMNLRLRADSPAIDRGMVLPNFNDGFAGAAPDMGAFEFE